MSKFIQENKIASTILSLCLVSLIGWGTWITVQVFEHSTYIALAQKSEQTVTKSLDEVKVDIKELKQEVKKDMQRIEEQNIRKQEEMLRILLEIKKNTKDAK
jgi:5-bromo-4-chloroindolyl phosphate hydrolysis protein